MSEVVFSIINGKNTLKTIKKINSLDKIHCKRKNMFKVNSNTLENTWKEVKEKGNFKF